MVIICRDHVYLMWYIYVIGGLSSQSDHSFVLVTSINISCLRNNLCTTQYDQEVYVSKYRGVTDHMEHKYQIRDHKESKWKSQMR